MRIAMWFAGAGAEFGRQRRRARRIRTAGVEQFEVRAMLSAFVVTSTVDAPDANPGDGVALTADGHTSLRAAIEEANAAPGADTIELPAGLFTLNPDHGHLDITDELTITGVGLNQTRIDASAIDSVFHLDGGVTLTLQSLTASGGDETAALESGASVTLVDSALEPAGSTFPRAAFDTADLSTGNRQTQLLIGLYGQLTATRNSAAEPLLITRPIIVDLMSELDRTNGLDATLGIGVPRGERSIAESDPADMPPRTAQAETDIPSARPDGRGKAPSAADPMQRRQDVIRTLFEDRDPAGKPVTQAVEPASDVRPEQKEPAAGMEDAPVSDPTDSSSPLGLDGSPDTRPVPPPLPEERQMQGAAAGHSNGAGLLIAATLAPAMQSRRWKRAWRRLTRWVGLAS